MNNKGSQFIFKNMQIKIEFKNKIRTDFKHQS